MFVGTKIKRHREQPCAREVIRLAMLRILVAL